MADEQRTIVVEGDTWQYKGQHYIIHHVGDADTWFKVKDTNDSNWYDAVEYSPETGDTDRRFVRRKDDFLNKFELVEE